MCILVIRGWATTYEGTEAGSKKAAKESAAAKFYEDPAARSRIKQLRSEETRSQMKKRHFIQGKGRMPKQHLVQ